MNRVFKFVFLILALFYSIHLSAQSKSAHKVISLRIGDSFKIGDIHGFFKNIERVAQVDGVELTEDDIALRAELVLIKGTDSLTLFPIYILKVEDGMVGYMKASNQELDITVMLTSILTKKKKFVFDFLTGSNVTEH